MQFRVVIAPAVSQVTDGFFNNEHNTMPYHTEQYRGFTITVDHDQDAENPRDWHSHVGTMACWHSRYNLGDEQPDKDPDEFLLDLVPDSIKQPFEDRLDRLWRYMRDSRECMGVSYHRCEELLEERKKDACEKWIDQNLFMSAICICTIIQASQSAWVNFPARGIAGASDSSTARLRPPRSSSRPGVLYGLELEVQFGEETMTSGGHTERLSNPEVETYDNHHG